MPAITKATISARERCRPVSSAQVSLEPTMRMKRPTGVKWNSTAPPSSATWRM